MITETQLQQARSAVEQAQAAVTLTEGLRPTETSGLPLANAKGRLQQAQKALRRLEAQAATDRAELAARPQREADAAGLVDAATGELDKSRARFTKAATAAQKALVELVDAAGTHSDLVRQRAAQLTAAGLVLRDDVDHPTGGGRDVVKLNGQEWPTVEPGVLLAWITYRVAAARLPRRYGLADYLRYWHGKDLKHLQDHRADLLAGMPAPATATHPEPMRPTHVPAQGAPVIWRDEFSRREAERRRAYEADELRKAHDSMERIAAKLAASRQQRIAAAG